MGHLPRTTPGNDIQFISSTMKSNVNKFILSWVGISFRVDFISDLMKTPFQKCAYFIYKLGSVEKKMLSGLYIFSIAT